MDVDGKWCPSISKFSNPLLPVNVNHFIECLDKLAVCPGHPDSHFVEFVMAKRKFTSANGKVTAVLDSTSDVTLNGDTFSNTVRVANCQMLVPSGKCCACVSYRTSLRTMYNRWLKNKKHTPTRRTNSSSRVNIRWLNTPEKRKRIQSIQRRLVAAERQVEQLKEKIWNSVKSHGVIVDNQLSNDLSQIVSDHTSTIIADFPKNSFQRLFWEQQREAMIKNPKLMR